MGHTNANRFCSVGIGRREVQFIDHFPLVHTVPPDTTQLSDSK